MGFTLYVTEIIIQIRKGIITMIEIQPLGDETRLGVAADGRDMHGDIHRPQDIADESGRAVTARGPM